MVWHYRKTDPELALERVVEIETVLNSLLTDQFQILNLDKAIEVTSRKFDKGYQGREREACPPDGAVWVVVDQSGHLQDG